MSLVQIEQQQQHQQRQRQHESIPNRPTSSARSLTPAISNGNKPDHPIPTDITSTCSMILTASLLLLETSSLTPLYTDLDSDDHSPPSPHQFEPIQSTLALTTPTTGLVDALAFVSSPNENAWQSSAPTSKFLTRSSNAFTVPPPPPNELPNYVYLLPRTYLQNWIYWAGHQPVPPNETTALKRTLRQAALIHNLKPPPNCLSASERKLHSAKYYIDPTSSPPHHPPQISPKFQRSNSFSDFDDLPNKPQKSLKRAQSAGTKEGRCSSTGRTHRHPVVFQQQEKCSSKGPGPMDAVPLSVLGYPLLLRPHVTVGKGEEEEEEEVRVSVRALSRSRSRSRSPMRKNRFRRSYSMGTGSSSSSGVGVGGEEEVTNGEVKKVEKVGCCVVSERFYELLRGVHGVKCTDSTSISFQPSPTSTSIALHHHVISAHNAPKPPSSTNHVKRANIPHPSSKSDVVLSPRYKYIPKKEEPSSCLPPLVSDQYHPIEFKRRVLKNPPRVEIYPVKFIYSIVEDGKETTSPTQSAISTSSQSSIGTSAPRFGEPDHIGILQKAASNMSQDPTRGLKPPRVNSPKRIQKSRRKKPPSAQDSVIATYPPRGFLLVSRCSNAAEALQELRNAAVPNKGKSCVRIWSKIGHISLRKKKTSGATQLGDGYDLVDLDELAARSSPSNPSEPMTVAEWVNIQNGTRDSKSIELFVEVRTSPTARWPREDLELPNRIKVGDFVDARDSTGKWYEAVVRDVSDSLIKVHYLGWSSRWDTAIARRDVNRDYRCPGPPAPLWSHSPQWRQEIGVGDEVEVREASSLVQRPRWFLAIVREVGREGDTPREIVGGAHLEACEEDDTGRKKPLLLLDRTKQVLVEVPQERFNSAAPVNPTTLSNFLAPQPPFLRWVNLYGEEICKVYTHNKPKTHSDQTPATIKYAHDPTRPPVEVLRSFNNIHGAGFVRETLRGVPPAPGSVGLHNLGNSCFLNSILQCLNHIEPLTQYFLKGDYRPDLNRTNPLGSGGRVALSYAALLNDMWGGEYSTLAPRMLKQTVASFAPQFNNHFQHDSQEFCSFLMDGLHEDLNRVQDKPYVEDLEGMGMKDYQIAIESWRKHLLRHDSIIVDYCQGMHRSHLACPKCEHESVKFDVYSTISLPLSKKKAGGTVTLKDCLKEFTSAEQLDVENAWYCPKCKEHVCARKLITLWSTPEILILHLKRFHFEKCAKRGGLVRSKVEDTVEFPVDGLDMTPYCMMPSDPEAPPVYKLFGVSEHTGSTANSGHYTATVRNSRDGKWYRYNDSHVGSTSGDASITGGAYLLFYQRSKGRARWAGMERFMKLRGIDPHGVFDPQSALDDDGFKEVKSKRKKKKDRGGKRG